MLAWALGFFIAALISAAFGFGAIASTFAGIAQILFYVFLGLLALTLILSLFSRHAPAAGRSVRLVSLLLIAGLVGVGVYAWMDHDMTAERVGREIDQGAVELTQNAGNAIEGAADRTGNFIQTSTSEVRGDAAGALDDAQQKVEPEHTEQN
jgi:uncharacterized membrane protein YtjA (UPF0391 family)